MKKIIVISASLLMMSLSFAEYNVVIGKGLPQESIKFVTQSTTPTEPDVPTLPPEPECKYDYPNNYWLNGRNYAYSIVHVLDNGTKVYDGKDIGTTTHIIGKYKYTRGDFIGNFGDYARYYVCKIAI